MKGCLEITVRNDSICMKDLLHCQEYHTPWLDAPPPTILRPYGSACQAYR